MKRIVIASLFSLAAAPVFATTPSFNDFAEQGQLEAGRAVIVTVAPSFNDQADLEAGRVAGLAGRAAVEIAQTQNVIWTPAY
jgi:hypothetical protein